MILRRGGGALPELRGLRWPRPTRVHLTPSWSRPRVLSVTIQHVLPGGPGCYLATLHDLPRGSPAREGDVAGFEVGDGAYLVGQVRGVGWRADGLRLVVRGGLRSLDDAGGAGSLAVARG